MCRGPNGNLEVCERQGRQFHCHESQITCFHIVTKKKKWNDSFLSNWNGQLHCNIVIYATDSVYWYWFWFLNPGYWKRPALQWFSSSRADNVPISGPLLKLQANKIARSLGHDWKCSEGWLSRFKRRHSIVFKCMSSERNAVDEASTDQWIKDVVKPIWLATARKTCLTVMRVVCFGAYCQTELWPSSRINDEVQEKQGTCNISVVYQHGWFAKKRPSSPSDVLHNPGLSEVWRPYRYNANASSWMTSELFKTWLMQFDRRMKAEKRSVLLTLDNCTAHEKFQPQLKAAELLFLTPNSTSKTQPLDQGVVQIVKVHYRNAHLMQLVARLDAGLPRKDFSINILQALTMLRDAWDQVLPETISNCFRKAGFTCTECSSIESADRPHDNIPLQPEPLLSRLFEEYNISP